MIVLVLHAAATWFMVGLIWVVQSVHYPLFASVGTATFTEYEAGHTMRIGRLLAIPAGVELATAAALVFARPAAVPLGLVLSSGAVLAAIWVMTALVQGPAHGRLGRGFDADEVTRLLRSNWWRTAGWTIRGIAAGAMLLMAV